MPLSQLFLIDAHALCYRSFFAIRGLTTRNGQATNAIYGFVNTLRKILKDHGPAYMAVCFDARAKTRREEMFSEYKMQRPAMPDDLSAQIPLIKEVVDAYRIPVFEKDGYEADDVMAALAAEGRRQGWEVVIVSDDKDMFQLAGEHVRIFSPRKDAFLDRGDIAKTLGIDPVYVPDYLALAGDKTDNIPGVKGIGQVMAVKLINRYGAVEDMLRRLDEIEPARVRELLAEQRDMLTLSKSLAVLEADVPLALNLDDLKIEEPDYRRLFDLFTRFEFRRFAEDAATHLGTVQPTAQRRVDGKADVADLIAAIRAAGQFAFMIEPLGDQEDMFGRGLAVAVDGQENVRLSADDARQLAGLLADETILKITYDVKARRHGLASSGLTLQGPLFDMMLAGYLLHPTRTGFQLETLAWQYLNQSLPEQDSWAVQPALMARLYAPLRNELKDKDLLKLYEDIERPLADVLFRMEAEGVKLDEILLKSLSQECQKDIEALTRDIYTLAGEEFNLNSPKQLGCILFEKIGLPPVKKTKTGFSTNEEVLQRLALNHELPGKILEYRQLAKLKSTYIDAFPRLVDPRTGRIHATFDQTGTETGRLSSHDPNLQNIPIRSELGRQIRAAFVPSDDEHVLIAADYSQIELRILAHLSDDPQLAKAFANDEDIHAFTAALVFDVPMSEVTPAMRNTAKRVNFGIIYGMSAFGLAKDLQIPQSEAQAFIDRYFLRYPNVQAFMQRCIKECEDKGYVVTLLNRRRYIPEIKSPNIGLRQFAQRQAINTPVQGSAADLIKLAMIRIQEEIERRKIKSRMIITVHDELVFDALKSEAREMMGFIRDCMESTLTLKVPVRAAIQQGPNWAQTK